MADITIKNGEGKTLEFTITRDSATIDVSSATFRFVVKEEVDDTTYKIEKTDGDFDKSRGASGIVTVNIGASETTSTLLPTGRYLGELRVIITAETDVDKSTTFTIAVEESLMHD
jgi:hypothetical protein